MRPFYLAYNLSPLITHRLPELFKTQNYGQKNARYIEDITSNR
jgi:hypothetical protein